MAEGGTGHAPRTAPQHRSAAAGHVRAGAHECRVHGAEGTRVGVVVASAVAGVPRASRVPCVASAHVTPIPHCTHMSRSAVFDINTCSN
jgi:hypothetical protein